MLTAKMLGEDAEIVKLFLGSDHGILCLGPGQIFIADEVFKIVWEDAGGSRSLGEFLFKPPNHTLRQEGFKGLFEDPLLDFLISLGFQLVFWGDCE